MEKRLTAKTVALPSGARRLEGYAVKAETVALHAGTKTAATPLELHPPLYQLILPRQRVFHDRVEVVIFRFPAEDFAHAG